MSYPGIPSLSTQVSFQLTPLPDFVPGDSRAQLLILQINKTARERILNLATSNPYYEKRARETSNPLARITVPGERFGVEGELTALTFVIYKMKVSSRHALNHFDIVNPLGQEKLIGELTRSMKHGTLDEAALPLLFSPTLTTRPYLKGDLEFTCFPREPSLSDRMEQKRLLDELQTLKGEHRMLVRLLLSKPVDEIPSAGSESLTYVDSKNLQALALHNRLVLRLEALEKEIVEVTQKLKAYEPKSPNFILDIRHIFSPSGYPNPISSIDFTSPSLPTTIVLMLERGFSFPLCRYSGIPRLIHEEERMIPSFAHAMMDHFASAPEALEMKKILKGIEASFPRIERAVQSDSKGGKAPFCKVFSQREYPELHSPLIASFIPANSAKNPLNMPLFRLYYFLSGVRPIGGEEEGIDGILIHRVLELADKPEMLHAVAIPISDRDYPFLTGALLSPHFKDDEEQVALAMSLIPAARAGERHKLYLIYRPIKQAKERLSFIALEEKAIALAKAIYTAVQTARPAPAAPRLPSTPLVRPVSLTPKAPIRPREERAPLLPVTDPMRTNLTALFNRVVTPACKDDEGDTDSEMAVSTKRMRLESDTEDDASPRSISSPSTGERSDSILVSPPDLHSGHKRSRRVLLASATGENRS